ncbi:MAG: ABC transporter permease [Bacteroidota bacterium]|nr:ABC transporter permease [Candidatus Kapabacteria bacterium]MCX7937533.1 ABC transporter permease [Chlorobiota bacterium]MDW8074843.1 ABC transporter permease [Bacteroidota bacterium]
MPAMIPTIVRLELWRIYRKPRSWIVFTAIAVLVGIVHSVMALQGEQLAEMVLQNIKQQLSIEGDYLHGYLVAFIIQGLLLVHLPFLVTLVAGDLIAGEAAYGTLRLLFLQPVARWKFVLAKFFALVGYVGSVMLFLAVVSLGVGVALFDVGDLVVLKTNGVVVLGRDDILWRFAGAYAFNWLGLLVPASLALLLGCFADNALAPVVGTMAIVIVMTAVSLLDVPLIESLADGFFTTHAAAWRLFFDDPVPFDTIRNSAVVLVMHCVVFCFVTALVLQRKDIRS